MDLACLLAAVVVGTWNGQWFPSGRAEHRAPEAVEAETIRMAGERLAEGLRAVDPDGTNEVILCLNEIRGLCEATNLVAQIGRPGLRVAVITGYRRRDRFDMQQDVIATTLPVADPGWSKWKIYRRQFLPRGYARTAVILEPAVTANVYSVHLKSNYGQTSAELEEANRLQRTKAVEQLLAIEPSPTSRRRKNAPPRRPVIIAGDFNADRWSARFKKETLFDLFAQAGFADVFAGVPETARVTYPGKGRWSNSTFDYIMFRGFVCGGPTRVIPAQGVSDHNPVFTVLQIQPPEETGSRRTKTRWRTSKKENGEKP